MQKLILTLGLFFLGLNAFGQNPTQTIKGSVLDKDSKAPLIGATIEILDTETPLGTITDIDGRFSLANVPVGRQKVRCSYLGYRPYYSDNIILNSAKELELNIELVESSEQLGEIIVKATQTAKNANNEDLVVSALSFSIEDIKSNAASANDPGRMAMAFPGVQPSRDTRSDIVIRGNSGIGLLWRLEGIDIPNPNHFARRGSSGGGITIFSLSMLSNSDFSTGAFSAEYGNAFSGVFDIKFRNGNRDKQEYSFRAGMLGLDFSTEGPIRKGRSSYLVNYRYSTLGILNAMGIHLVGPRVSNTFQDLSFKLNFTSEDNKSIISVWGIGGLSDEFEDVEEGIENWKSFSDYYTRDFETNMGALGMSYTRLFEDQSYLKTNFAMMAQQIFFSNDTLSTELIPGTINDEAYTNGRYTLSTHYNKKFSPKVSLKTGAFLNSLFYNLQHDLLLGGQTVNFIDTKDNSLLLQPYANVRIRPSDDWHISLGLHALYFSLNNSFSLEPRLAIKRVLSKNNSISMAYGLHGRILPIGSYFTKITDQQNQVTMPNQNLEMIKSHHWVLAYDQLFADRLRFHSELYLQKLFDVPVSNDINSSYSILNEIDGYATRALVSEGSGQNIGWDISLQQSFDDGLFFLLSGSVFQSSYKAINGKKFSTRYDSGVAGTLLVAKELNLKNNAVLQTGLKLLYNGGQRLTPILSPERDPFNPLNPILDESKAFSEKVSPYFRPDIRVAYRKDKTNYSWWLALDVQNIIARKNIDSINRTYDPDLGQWVFREQSSLTPVLSYQIDF